MACEISLEKALEIQQRQLKGWKSILKKNCYSKLESWTQDENKKSKTGNQIKRGNDLHVYIFNELIPKKYY